MKPDWAEAHANLGTALKEQGKLDEAVACYRRALELKPEYAEAHYFLGNALSEQGNQDEAIECHREAIACSERLRGTGSRSVAGLELLGKALGELAFYLGNRLPEGDLIAMRQLLSEADFGGDGRIAVEYGLARILDAAGNYDEAAEHLRAANALRAAQLPRGSRNISRPATESSSRP